MTAMELAFILFQLAFVVLKLCGVIGWPWGMVLMPLWIDLGMTAVSLIVFAVKVWRKMK